MSDATVVLGPRFLTAIEYGSRWHATQVRKGSTTPYMCHLLGAASLVLEAGADEDVAIAALLHDTAEDCGGEARLTEIREMFGPRVESIVRACSDSITDDPDVKQEWQVRKRRHIDHLRDADYDVLIVTAADKLHNARAIWVDVQIAGLESLERFKGSPTDIVWYHESILEILIEGGVPDVLTLPLAETIGALTSQIDGGAKPAGRG